jgi:hypothetical protein
MLHGFRTTTLQQVHACRGANAHASYGPPTQIETELDLQKTETELKSLTTNGQLPCSAALLPLQGFQMRIVYALLQRRRRGTAPAGLGGGGGATPYSDCTCMQRTARQATTPSSSLVSQRKLAGRQYLLKAAQHLNNAPQLRTFQCSVHTGTQGWIMAKRQQGVRQQV